MRGDVNIFCKFGLAGVMLLLFGCAGGQNSPARTTSTVDATIPAASAKQPLDSPRQTASSQAASSSQPDVVSGRFLLPDLPPSATATSNNQPVVDAAPKPTQPASTATNLAITASATEQADIHHTDLWQRIRAGFGLPDMNSRFVTLQERWLSKRPEYVARLLQRAQRYLPYIVEQVAARGMPMEIALLPAIESAYRPTATSRARAAGLWQFMPATGRRFGLQQNWWLDQRRDLTASTDAALNYLDYLHTRLNGNWILALAAYNAGEATIERAIRYNRKHRRKTNFSSLRLRLETRQYIPKLIAFRNIINAPEQFGLTLPTLPVKSSYARVPLPYQLDLNIAAKLLDMPIAELLAVNGNFLRWTTPPGKNQSLLIPASKAAGFNQALAKLPVGERIRWAHYRVRKGDTLGAIARRHKVSLVAVKRANRIRGYLINIGQNLLIPLSEGATNRLAMRDSRPARKVSRSRQRRKRPFVHRVRNGDTLWGIARRYQVKVSQLRSWNTLRKRSVLRRGQPIRIYAAN